ncbi:hypothetical protein K6119_08265 [Paracrocinitomix mangrovi]|uniref:hypothetical protein n=1 Tax=Paracrocinitomix mangrovi TaxID=2862509 RepID=UPI001C8E5C46|nr:hypothetical protein [Paracrocinitomix mangrovi]UKN03507.1 hypothetical protein K6119_08265 [Paracrocinitomix mangrovi]
MLKLLTLAILLGLISKTSYSQYELKPYCDIYVSLNGTDYDPDIPFAPNKKKADPFIVIKRNGEVFVQSSVDENSTTFYFKFQDSTFNETDTISFILYDDDMVFNDHILTFSLIWGEFLKESKFEYVTSYKNEVARLKKIYPVTVMLKSVNFDPTKEFVDKKILRKIKKHGIYWTINRNINGEIVKFEKLTTYKWNCEGLPTIQKYPHKSINFDVYYKPDKYWSKFKIPYNEMSLYKTEHTIKTKIGTFTVNLEIIKGNK